MKTLRKILFALPLLLSTPAYAGADPFIGEIMWLGANYCPEGWVQANGQLLNTNDARPLFALIGNQFGGDGRSTFAVPDLRGATIVGAGATRADTFFTGQRRWFSGCPDRQQCPQDGTTSLTMLPCIAVQGIFPSIP